MPLGSPLQWLGSFNALAPLGAMQGFPKVVAALEVEPEIGTVAENACQHERRIRCDAAPVGAEFIDVLALDTHRFGQLPLREAKRVHELLAEHFPDADRLAFCHQHDVTSPVGMVVEIEVTGLAVVSIPFEYEPPLLVDPYGVPAIEMP